MVAEAKRPRIYADKRGMKELICLPSRRPRTGGLSLRSAFICVYPRLFNCRPLLPDDPATKEKRVRFSFLGWESKVGCLNHFSPLMIAPNLRAAVRRPLLNGLGRFEQRSRDRRFATR
jgi:hypothetical protein